MKSIGIFILSTLLFTIPAFADAPKTKEEFLSSVKAAFEAKDVKKIRELSWEKGQTDFDDKQEARILPMMVKDVDGTEIFTFEPMPSDFQGQQIAMGRKIESTHQPDGMLKIAHNAPDGKSKWSFMLPYAQIDGVFYLVGTKSTDLGWKGPADRPISINVMGAVAGKIKIHVKYNASGVDLETETEYSSLGVLGQYVTEVTAINDADDAEMTLELSDRKGNLHYKSEPLKGKGTLHYHKDDEGTKTN